MSWRTIFFFDEMITPLIINLIYWLGLVAIIILGFGTMFGFGVGGFSFGSFVKGILTIVLGAVGVRMWCELVIVLFKSNEYLKKIAGSK